MRPGDAWIERGPDGRPYFVRKKSTLPSTRDLLSTALTPFRQNSFSFPRSFGSRLPAPVNNQLYLSAPPNSFLHQHNIASTSDPLNMPLRPFSYPSESSNNQQGNSHQSPGILKPSPSLYPVPHPAMYPGTPPGTMPIFNPAYNPQGQLQLAQMPHAFPTHHAGAYAGQPFPTGAGIMNPPRLPTAAELKYKCATCGRFRSARYHREHPLPQGALPGQTVCRRCQDEAKDSDDESSTSSDGRQERQRRRRRRQERIRSQHRSISVETGPRRSRSRRGRSASRGLDSEDYYHERPRRYSHSRSSSLEVLPFRSRSRILGRGRSSSVETVHYIERRRRPQLTRRITYVEDDRPRRRDRSCIEYDSDESEYRPAYRTRRLTRPPTPAPRVIRRQHSDPAFAADYHGYYDGPDSAEEEVRFIRPDPARRFTRDRRITSTPFSRYNVRSFASDLDLGTADPRFDGMYHRSASAGGTSSRGRSGSRPNVGRSGREMRDRSASDMARAPSPPDTSDSEHCYLRRSSRDRAAALPESARRYRRARSRSQAARSSRMAATFLRPGDAVTVIEEQQPPQREFDWYDRDGMRVRVREI